MASSAVPFRRPPTKFISATSNCPADRETLTPAPAARHRRGRVCPGRCMVVLGGLSEPTFGRVPATGGNIVKSAAWVVAGRRRLAA